MMVTKIFLVFSASLILLLKHANGFLLVPSFKTPKFQSSNESELEPLFLTPILEKKNYSEAQRLAKVYPSIGNVTSYSGFFTVNETCKSNLFFWFFPAQKENWEDAPVLLWLQGGPGSSSMFGVFDEIGPFEYSKEGFKKRQYSWNAENNFLIIDQPVGVGYSFTGESCYAKDETKVGQELYTALIQFFELFPNLKENKFFIAGESYAGHYIPALGHTIHKNNPSAKVKVNLSAMMVGNGLIDPVNQMDFGSFLYQIGLIDDEGRAVYKMGNDIFQQVVNSEIWDYAASSWLDLVGLYYNYYVGSKVNKYNYVQEWTIDSYWQELMQTSDMRNALHAGGGEYRWLNPKVYSNLITDIPKSVKPWVEELLEHYPIIFFHGQLDIICGYPMAVNFFRSLSWSGQSQYLNATRSKWCVGEELAGYFKGEHRLFEILVRRAGHLVPKDQPHWAYELVNSITSGSPDNPLHALEICSG